MDIINYMVKIFTRCFAVSFFLFAGLSCRKSDDLLGSTEGTALYLFNSSSANLQVYNNLETRYLETTLGIPSTTLTHPFLTRFSNLAWGGMSINTQANQLYLVSETGDVARVNRLRQQTGTISDQDLIFFKLDASQRLSNSKFGQISIDPSSGTLYVTEDGDNLSRIWVITNAGSRTQDESVALNALQTTNDIGGRSLVAFGGSVFCYANNGSSVLIGTESVSGPRLRKGTSSGFISSNQLIGTLTQLGQYSSLALDSGNSILYVGVHIQDAGRNSSQAPVLAFDVGQFGLSFNQPPRFTMGSGAILNNLRVLNHAGSKQWLAGLGSTNGIPTNQVWIAKNPAANILFKSFTISGSPAATLRGVSLDGNSN